ncbi:MAG: prepilin peptidase [Deferribacterales bacterium]
MYIIFFVMGTIFGSFMNVLIYRLPRYLSIITPSSHCPKCKKSIPFYYNVPIIGYIILKGKCKYCGEKISLMYPLVEVINGLVFLLIYHKYQLTFTTFSMLCFSFIMLTAGFTDLFTAFDKENFECGVIPSIVLYTGIAIGIIFSFFNDIGIFNSIIGGVLGYLSLFIPATVYKIIRKVEGMGEGDLYLMAVVGVFLGYKSILPVMIFASFFGALVGIIIIKVYKDNSFPIPFGPFITFASIFYIFYGEDLINGYLKLIRN